MSFRTVIIKERSKLETKMGFLVVRGETEKQIHLSEIQTLIIESTAIALTAQLICELVKRNINIIFCDEKHLPHSQLLPLFGNFNVSKNIMRQINWNSNIKQIAWTQIVYQKICMQKNLLIKYKKLNEAKMLDDYLNNIKLGDTTNREGHAAKVYFNALFGLDFSRRQENDFNPPLNYGYSILLSAVAREIISAGYITPIGIFHCNEFNFYNFGCDLMEPFRPIIDDYVLTFIDKNENDFKNSMRKIFETQIKIAGQNQFFDNAIKIFVRSVFKFLNREEEEFFSIMNYEFKKE